MVPIIQEEGKSQRRKSRHQVKLENGWSERAFLKATLEDKGKIKEEVLNKSYLLIVDKDQISFEIKCQLYLVKLTIYTS